MYRVAKPSVTPLDDISNRKLMFVAAYAYGNETNEDSFGYFSSTTDCFIQAVNGEKYAIHHIFLLDWWPQVVHPGNGNCIHTTLSQRALELFINIVYYRSAKCEWTATPELLDFASVHELQDLQRELIKYGYEMFTSSNIVRVWIIAAKLAMPEEPKIRKKVGACLAEIVEKKLQPSYNDIPAAPYEAIMNLMNASQIPYSSASFQARVIVFWAKSNRESVINHGQELYEILQFDSLEERKRCISYMRYVFSKLTTNEHKKVRTDSTAYSSFRPRLSKDVMLYFGGSTSRSEQQNVYIYDEPTETWAEVPALKLELPAGYIKAIVVDKEIFLLDNSFPDRNSVQAINLKQTPLRYYWKGCFDDARAYFTAAVCGRKIYCFGGSINRVRLASAVAYNVDTCCFETLPPMPIGGRSDAVAVTFENKIYVIGGYNGNHTLDIVEVYNPSTNQWSSFPPLQRARSGHSIVVYNGTMYAVGGFCHGASIDAVEYYDRKAQRWTLAPSLNKPRSNLSTIVFRGKIWALGGNHISNDVHSSVEVFDGHQWTFTNSLPKPLVTGSVVVIPTENLDVKEVLGWNL